MPFLIGLGLKLLGVGRWLKEALGALLRWAGRNPWQALIIALCAFSGWLWLHDSRVIDGLAGKLATANKTISDMKAASEQNRLAQLAQKAKAEQRYKDIAHEADKEHAEQLADANDALARYIATHRVRAGEGGFSIRPAGSVAEGGSAEVPASLPTDSFVAVSDDDMHRCTAIATYALDAHNWALKLAEQK